MKFIKKAFTVATTPLFVILAIANIIRTFILKIALLIPVLSILLIAKLFRLSHASIPHFIVGFLALDCISFGHSHHHNFHMQQMQHLAHQEHLRQHEMAHHTAMDMHNTAHNIAVMNNMPMM